MAKITGGKIMNLIVRGSVFGGWVALMNERGHVSHMINLPGLPAPSHPAAVSVKRRAQSKADRSSYRSRRCLSLACAFVTTLLHMESRRVHVFRL